MWLENGKHYFLVSEQNGISSVIKIQGKNKHSPPGKIKYLVSFGKLKTAKPLSCKLGFNVNSHSTKKHAIYFLESVSSSQN